MPFMCKTTVHFMEEYDLRGRNDKYSKTKTPQNALERALRENRWGHVFLCYWKYFHEGGGMGWIGEIVRLT